MIRPVIAERNPQAGRSHDQQVRWLKQRIAQRDESLKRQLTTMATPMQFASNGAARLTGWKSKAQSGEPRFDERQGADGAGVLYIAAAEGNSIVRGGPGLCSTRAATGSRDESEPRTFGPGLERLARAPDSAFPAGHSTRTSG